MPVTYISQPTPSQLLTAYKPVVFAVTATTVDGKTPSIVFCDVYINSVYFRTFFSSKADSANHYIFDIQDAIQEKLEYFIPPIDGSKIQINNASLVDVFVKIRTAKIDSSGLNQSEQIPPIPGNDDDKPITGQGYISNKFYVLNALIQNEENQNFIDLMKSFRKGQWNAESLPLTRRNEINLIQAGQSSYFPVLTDKEVGKIKLSAKYKGETSFREYERIIVPDDVDEVSNPPSINIKWHLSDDSENINPYIWDLKYGSFPLIRIKTYPEDPDNDVEKVELFQNKDAAGFVSLGELADSLYEITDLTIGDYQFKAIVTDSKNNTAESNILNYLIKDTTPAPGTINLEENETVPLFGGSYFTRVKPGPVIIDPETGNPTETDLYTSTYSISFSESIKIFYENKGMTASELRIKFKNIEGYTDWRYNNTLVTEVNYSAIEVSPDILNQFNASSNIQEMDTATIIHEFEIYHIADPSQIFTNYLQMTFD